MCWAHSKRRNANWRCTSGGIVCHIYRFARHWFLNIFLEYFAIIFDFKAFLDESPYVSLSLGAHSFPFHRFRSHLFCWSTSTLIRWHFLRPSLHQFSAPNWAHTSAFLFPHSKILGFNIGPLPWFGSLCWWWFSMGCQPIYNGKPKNTTRTTYASQRCNIVRTQDTQPSWMSWVWRCAKHGDKGCQAICSLRVTAGGVFLDGILQSSGWIASDSATIFIFIGAANRKFKFKIIFLSVRPMQSIEYGCTEHAVFLWGLRFIHYLYSLYLHTVL